MVVGWQCCKASSDSLEAARGHLWFAGRQKMYNFDTLHRNSGVGGAQGHAQARDGEHGRCGSDDQLT